MEIICTGKQCEDVNECEDPLNCRKGQCRNTPGGFQCVCPSGMKYNEDTKACQDVDECSDEISKCPNGQCINTLGGYKCQCQSGTSLDPTGQVCVDSRRGKPLNFPTYPNLLDPEPIFTYPNPDIQTYLNLSEPIQTYLNLSKPRYPNRFEPI